MCRMAEPSLADSFGLPFSSLVNAVDVNNKLESTIMLVLVSHIAEGRDNTWVIGKVRETIGQHFFDWQF